MSITNETVIFFLLDANLSTSSASSDWARNSSLPIRHLSVIDQVVITTFYLLGVLGNIAALVILYRRASQPRNPKHALMLRCLASNDLIAVSGMLILMNLQLCHPSLSHSRVFCILRVIWRLFGLGSGCVAIVMAAERWLALTKPFFYQKHITTAVIRRSIFSLWSVALLLVCLPFLGFGMYFEPRSATCVRYRQADNPKDVAYAYLFLIFGLVAYGLVVISTALIVKTVNFLTATHRLCALYGCTGSLLCLGIVWFNLAVDRTLCHKAENSDSSTNFGTTPRRISGSLLCLGIVWFNLAVARTLCRTAENSDSSTNFGTTPRRISGNQTLAHTREELAFARLMAVFCVVFVMCWMPQMGSILIAQVFPETAVSRKFFRLADVLMLLHFCLDPYLYVLQRWPCFRTLCGGLLLKSKHSVQANSRNSPPISKELSQDLILSVKNLKL